MKISTKSFDCPVSQKSEDALDRWRTAQDICSLTNQIPADWSCRIGVTGTWGAGKTSVLKFVETQAEAAGLISFWINPSEAKDIDSLWGLVLRRFLDALAAEGLLASEVRRKRFRGLSSKLLSPAQQVADLNRYSKALVGSAKDALSEWLKPDGKQILALRHKLHTRRVLVFVDDLDRADPRLIPALLLGLRDILDLPGFCFVLGFDEDIVSSSLVTANPSWHDGKAFLDKIIDFSFNLEEVTPEHHYQLVSHHLQATCPWMELDVIKGNADILPSNPRKLKTFVRNLLAIAELVKRHSSNEIQWPDLFFGQLVKVESPTFLARFLREPGNEALLTIGFSQEHPRSKEISFEQHLDTAISSAGVTDVARRERLKTILTAWQKRRGIWGLNAFKYYALFGMDYPDVTWSELSGFTSAYSTTGDLEAVAEAIQKHADLHYTSEAAIYAQVLRLSVESRHSHLNVAADSLTQAEVQNHLSAAKDVLTFIAAIIEQSPLPSAIGPEAIKETISSLLTQTLYWIHFTVPPYNQSREHERETILCLARLPLIDAIDWLGFLLKRRTYIDNNAHTNAMGLTGQIRAIQEDALIRSALALLDEQNSNISVYRPGAEARWFLFFSPDSPLWTDKGIKALESHLTSLGNSPPMQENAIEFLEGLTGSMHGSIGASASDLRGILTLPNVGRILWAAATITSINYRMQQRLLDIRTGAIAFGLDKDCMPIPSWLVRRAQELGIA